MPKLEISNATFLRDFQTLWKKKIAILTPSKKGLEMFPLPKKATIPPLPLPYRTPDNKIEAMINVGVYIATFHDL